MIIKMMMYLKLISLKLIYKNNIKSKIYKDNNLEIKVKQHSIHLQILFNLEQSIKI